MKRQILLGLGAGQCGTRLLAEILNRQPGVRVTHEEPPLLAWQAEDAAGMIARRIERMLAQRQEPVVGDVASFYLPYLEAAIRQDPSLRAICLKRPEAEVVEGMGHFLDASRPLAVNHWAREPGPGWHHDPVWTRVFPQYDTPDRDEGIRRYWREYYTRAEALAQAYPQQLRIWDTEVLTTEVGVREVLTFAGIPRETQVIVTGRRTSSSETEGKARRKPRPKPRAPQDPRKCVVLVPFTSFIHPECDEALKELERRGYRVWRVGGYAAIDQGRNQMATDAILEGFEETLWIDSDIGFHPDAVERLRAHPQAILCGIYPQKGKRALACHVMPGAPSMVFGKRGGLVEILYAGAGFLLVRRETYLTLQQKLALPICNERFGRPTIPFFQPMVREIEEAHWYLAEDYAFCQRARECGYQVWADTTIRLWHVGQYRYGWEDAGLERQRFGSFTLNFRPAAGTVHETQTQRPPALATLAAEYPWPTRRPEPPASPPPRSLDPAAQELLARSITPATRLILELGSSTGQTTRHLATAAPGATILACDPWDGSDELPPPSTLVLHLFDTFLATCWDDRSRILPIRLPLPEALERIAETGLKPDLIHFAAESTDSALTQLVTAALDLFPRAILVGHEIPNTSTCRALETLAQARQRPLEARSPAWRILPVTG